MEIATGNYLNVFSEINRPGDKERDIIVLFNEPNSQPTGEELAALADMIVAEVEKDPTGASLQNAIEDSGMECVAFGVQVFAFGMDQPVKEMKVRRGRKPAYMKEQENLQTLAQELYNSTMDMGFMDYEEEKTKDMEDLLHDLTVLKQMGNGSLLNAIKQFCHKSSKERSISRTVRAVDIEWDVEDEADLENLPAEIEIPEYIKNASADGQIDKDVVADYLSDVTGFCHKGFRLTTDPED